MKCQPHHETARLAEAADLFNKSTGPDHAAAFLRGRLRGRSYPLWRFPDGLVLTAANLWAAARQWVHLAREADLGAGDRVVIRAEPGAGFLAALVAGWSERWSMLITPPTMSLDDPDYQLWRPQMMAGFAGTEFSVPWNAGGAPLPPTGWQPATRSFEAHEPARFVLRTSGSGGSPVWVVLSDRNVRAVITSHLPLLGWSESTRLLSVLPWHHAFGFVLELLMGIAAGASFLRCEPNPGDLHATIVKFRPDQLLTVPSLIHQWARFPTASEDWPHLAGGIVGGAAVDRALEEFLSMTRLRVGYGLTEASPGISLGEPGEWEENLLGAPLGCAVRIADDGELFFRGPNACFGTLKDGEIQPLNPDRWQATGDRATENAGRLFFLGRKSLSVKLDNGRWFHPGEWEAAICARFAGVDSAIVLVDRAGRNLVALVCIRDGLMPTLADLRNVFGGLQNRLVDVREKSPDMLPRSGKGDVDRQAMQREIFPE